MREREIQTKIIRHLPLEPAVCLTPETPLHNVIARMRQDHSSCVLICNQQNECVGIFTERDYLNKVLGGQVDRSRPVQEFMTPQPQTLSANDTVGQAIALMDEHGFRNIPLVDASGKCAGLLQIRNIIQFLAELYPEEVLNVQPRRESFPEPDGA